jgi:hypothetical protein
MVVTSFFGVSCRGACGDCTTIGDARPTAKLAPPGVLGGFIGEANGDENSIIVDPNTTAAGWPKGVVVGVGDGVPRGCPKGGANIYSSIVDLTPLSFFNNRLLKSVVRSRIAVCAEILARISKNFKNP